MFEQLIAMLKVAYLVIVTSVLCGAALKELEEKLFIVLQACYLMTEKLFGVGRCVSDVSAFFYEIFRSCFPLFFQ